MLPERTALLYSFCEWPVFPYIQRARPLPQRFLDHGCWLHASLPHDDSRIFELLPEPKLSAKTANDGLFASRLMHHLYEAELHDSLWAGHTVTRCDFGFHASEKLPAVRAAFEADGFEVLTLLEWQATMYASFNLGSESQRREAIGRRFTDGTLPPSAKHDAARAATMRYVLDGGARPARVARAFPLGWLERSLEGCVERWDSLDERLLDAVCANCRAPQDLRWQASRAERGLDRHGALREKLLARGWSEGWVLAATLQSMMACASAKLWVLSLAGFLDEALGWIAALRPKSAQAPAVKALFLAFADHSEMALSVKAIKAWREANPFHPLVDESLEEILKRWDD